MYNTIFSKGSIPALEALMHFTTARHKAIANNIANVETPGYKAMDAPEQDFRTALTRAFEDQGRSRVGVFELEPYRNVRPAANGLDVRYVESPEAGILRHIENNVDLDMEMGRMTKNAGLHNLAATLLSHQFGQLRVAISERVTG
jgi:flagellar basal-body rod protein FlgB